VIAKKGEAKLDFNSALPRRIVPLPHLRWKRSGHKSTQRELISPTHRIDLRHLTAIASYHVRWDSSTGRAGEAPLCIDARRRVLGRPMRA